MNLAALEAQAKACLDKHEAVLVQPQKLLDLVRIANGQATNPLGPYGPWIAEAKDVKALGQRIAELETALGEDPSLRLERIEERLTDLEGKVAGG